MSLLRVLIADDETPARRRLQQFLHGEDDIRVIAEARNGLEAVEAIEQLAPDLVFLDVQMPELDGFKVVARLGIARMPATVFVTAYDEYALRAFDNNALDYLLKPFEQDRFQQTLKKLRGWLGRGGTAAFHTRLAQAAQDVAAAQSYPERLLLRSGEFHPLVKTAEIHYIKADGNYLHLHTAAGVHTIRESLCRFETRLDPKRFRRIHRSHIVNVDQVTKFQPWFGGDYLVIMADGSRLTLSRTYRQVLEEWL